MKILITMIVLMLGIGYFGLVQKKKKAQDNGETK